MGIMDDLLRFSNVQDLGSVSASSATAGTNTVDRELMKNHLGDTITPSEGEAGDAFLNVRVEDEVLRASGSAGTLVMTLKSHASVASVASGSTVMTKTVSVANSASSALADGALLWKQALPAEAMAQHIGIFYEPKTMTKILTGKVTAWISYGQETETNLKGP